MSGRRARHKRRNPEWTPFVQVGVNLPDGGLAFASEELDFDCCFKNSKYMVFVRVHHDDGQEKSLDHALHLSLKRLDKAPVHDWRDLQRIKNEICGDEREGFEIYPAESRLVDTANQYHLWILPKGEKIHVGFQTRMVGNSSGRLNSKQRRVDPDRATHTPDELEALARQQLDSAITEANAR